MPHITSTGLHCTEVCRVDPEYAGVPDQGRDVVIRDQRQHVVRSARWALRWSRTMLRIRGFASVVGGVCYANVVVDMELSPPCLRAVSVLTRRGHY